jgi:hypothetical protein
MSKFPFVEYATPASPFVVDMKSANPSVIGQPLSVPRRATNVNGQPLTVPTGSSPSAMGRASVMKSAQPVVSQKIKILEMISTGARPFLGAAVKGAIRLDMILGAKEVGEDFGAGVGYLWNLPQIISNQQERDRLDKLLKDRELAPKSYSPNNQKFPDFKIPKFPDFKIPEFPNFGLPNPFSFDDSNEDNGYFQDASRVDALNPQPIYKPPFESVINSSGLNGLYFEFYNSYMQFQSRGLTLGDSNATVNDCTAQISVNERPDPVQGYTLMDVFVNGMLFRTYQRPNNTQYKIIGYNCSVVPQAPPAIPNTTPPPVYPDVQEWPYGNVDVKVGGVASSPIASLPNIESGLPEITPQETPDISPTFDPPAIAPDGFLPSELAPPLLSAPPQQMLLGRDSFISVPATQTPATQTPATQTPATQTPATQIFANETPKFPQVFQDPTQQYKDRLAVYPTTVNNNNPVTNIYNTTNQQGSDTSGLSNQISGVASLVSGVSSQVSGVSTQVSGVATMVAALPSLAQIKTKVAEAICEQSAPDGCIDNSNKRNKSSIGETVSITVREFVACNGENPEFADRIITVLKGSEQAIQGLYQNLADIEALQCKAGDVYAAVPEWWQIRPEAQRPQLILQFCAKLSQGKYGPPMYSITIPHPKTTAKLLSIPLDSYKKGSFEGELKLADNSKIIVNCESQKEAERVLSIITSMVSNQMLEGSSIKLSERRGKPVKKQDMYIRIATLFEKGVADSNNYKWKSKYELPTT